MATTSGRHRHVPATGSATPGAARQLPGRPRGAGLSADTRSSTQTNITEDLSLNLRWDVNERLGLNFDVQKIDSDGRQLRQQREQQDRRRPRTSTSAAASRTSSSASPPATAGRRAASPIRRTTSTNGRWSTPKTATGEELAVRLDADIQLDDGWIDSLRVGVRRADREQNVNWSTYNWGSVQPLWGLQTDDAVLPQPGSRGRARYQAEGPRFRPGRRRRVRRRHVPASALRHRQRLPRHVERCTATAAATAGSRWPIAAARWTRQSRADSIARSNSMDVTEDTRAAYVMLKFGGDDTKIGNVNVRGNIGVRWVKTDVARTGGVQFPTYDYSDCAGARTAMRIRARSLAPDDIAFMNSGDVHATRAVPEHDNCAAQLERALRSHRRAVPALRGLARPVARGHGSVQVLLHHRRGRRPTCADGTVTYTVPGDCTSDAGGLDAAVHRGYGQSARSSRPRPISST